MVRIVRLFIGALAALSLVAAGDSALAQGKGKDKDRMEQPAAKDKAGKEKVKQHHHDGKSLLGDKIKQNGKHKFHEHGKFSAFADVRGGKIAGVTVQHADRGNVPVKKYKTNRKMAQAPAASGIQPVSFILAQATGTQYLGQTWIGYAYIDDYGEEVIYWFPYDMILDADTGAIEYIPAY